MIGKGKNIKSMAYVGNLVSFIKNRIVMDEKSLQIFNYTDWPDITMIDLLNLIKKRLQLNSNNISLPYFIGLFIGHIFDFYSFVFNKKIIISSIRIKKFCKSTQFISDKAHSIFNPPFTLHEGIVRTLDHEFSGNNSEVEYFTE
jgi:hypothetical protein